MDLPTLNAVQAVYPKYISQFKNLINDPNVDVETKINTIILALNQQGLTVNQVINNWNQVMQWAMGDGLDQAVLAHMNEIVANGTFQSTLNTIVSKEGDLTKLTNPAPDLVTAINGNTASLADIALDVKNFGAKCDNWTDDSTAIQNAINSITTSGTVNINGACRILSTIVIPANVTLKLNKGASLRVGADVHGVQLKKNGAIEGGTIWFDFSNPTKSCIYVEGSEVFGTAYQRTSISHIKLESGNYGIYMYSNVSSGSISSITFRDVNIGYCTYGIKLQADNPTSGTTWVNGNIFDQITITGAQYFIYLASQDNAKSAVAGNIFKGLNFQADSSKNPQRYIHCEGQWNYFEGTMWDWSSQSQQATSIEFTSIASYNVVKTVRPTSEFLNSGSNNYMQTPYNPAYGLQDSNGYINSPIAIGTNQDIELKSSGSWAWIDNNNGTVRITSGATKGSINGLLINGAQVNTAHNQLDDGSGNLTVNRSLVLTPVTSANAQNGSLFVDSADNKLKFKDNAGTVTIIAS